MAHTVTVNRLIEPNDQINKQTWRIDLTCASAEWFGRVSSKRYHGQRTVGAAYVKVVDRVRP
jgi:hypothetical protein